MVNPLQDVIRLDVGALSPCSPELEQGNWALFVFFIALSTLFLGLNLIVYGLLWEGHNAHQWIQTSYLVSLLLFNVVFLPALVPGMAGDSVNVKPECFILSVLNQFFFIASKTWLLIISLDIFWTLWKFEPSYSVKRGKATLLLYTMFGWFVPFLFVSLGILLNLLLWNGEVNMNDRDLWVSYPNYGYRHCRIPTWNIWECFVFANCLIHIVLFLLIVTIILRHTCEVTSVLVPEAERAQRHRETLLMFLKLFIVVGLSWTYIAVQDLLNAGNINTPQSWGWHVFRAIFFLQGFFVTIIYVGNQKTVNRLSSKYPAFKKFLRIFKTECTCRRRLDKRGSGSVATVETVLHA